MFRGMFSPIIKSTWLYLEHLVCCILRGPGGERIVDIVQGGTELELQLRRGVGQAAHSQ
jgi:hypothetical protein